MFSKSSYKDTMKADIITMQAVYNYGSVLQTYATCEMFKQKGIDAEVIDYYPERLKGYGSLKQLYIDAKPFHGSWLKCALVAIANWPSYKLQARVFVPFKRKHIKLSEKYESVKEITKNPPVADIYCTGSDQVWNNYLDSKRQFDEVYFLNFGSPETKRIAYAASFGRSDFSEEERTTIAKFVERYDAVSTREESGIDIIKDCDISLKQCCLDPTFMIPRSKWFELMEPIKQEKYILVYQLHEDSITADVAIALGKVLSYKVIRISTALHRRIKGGTTVMLPSVGQFISYIKNAELVVTDSFHATAFSVNLNVPFISVKWKMFNDRIDTILGITGLQYRAVCSIDEAKQAVKKEINFDFVNNRLDVERHKSEEFFEKAIQI